MYDEHSTYSAEGFLISLIERCPVPIREIQTDNGTEFTKALTSNDPNDKNLFELKLEECQISYHRIRIATPRHNGKVERQHRIDQRRFYNRLRMFSLEDGRKSWPSTKESPTIISSIVWGFVHPIRCWRITWR